MILFRLLEAATSLSKIISGLKDTVDFQVVMQERKPFNVKHVLNI